MPFFSFSDRTFGAPAGGASVLPREFFLRDLDGDGRLDAFLTYQRFPLENAGAAPRLLKGDGSGGFTDQSSGGAPSMVDASSHAAADFNGDGRIDLVFGDAGYGGASPRPGAPNVLLLGGSGGFSNASSNLPGFSDVTPSISAGDVDRDGDVDLFVADLGSRGAYLLLNDGSARFSADKTRLPEIGDPSVGLWSTGHLFDANGDGAVDLFVGGQGQSRIVLNDGTGRFATVSSVFGFPAANDVFVVDAKSADLNGDGRLDLVVTLAFEGFSRGGVQILINQGGGVFADETAARTGAYVLTTTANSWIYRTELADLNGDGFADLVMTGGTTAPVLINDGTGRFLQTPGLIPGLSPLDRLAAGDIDGDGRTDLMIRRGGDTGGVERFTLALRMDPGDLQTGGAGADVLLGDGGADSLMGEAGDDVLAGAGGRDFVRGGDGADKIAGGAEFDDLHGNMGADTVSGGGGDDWVVGGKDEDLLFGDDGADVVLGNIGADTLEGGEGHDVVRGGQGNDSVRGGAGNDWVSGDRGEDVLSGGFGADVFHTFDGAGLDRVTDFNAAEGDRVQLLPGATYTAREDGAHVVVEVGEGRLVLENVQLSSLTDGWIFGF